MGDSQFWLALTENDCIFYFPKSSLDRKPGISLTTEFCLLFDADQLRHICEEYHKRIVGVEDAKYDIEKEVELRDYKV